MTMRCGWCGSENLTCEFVDIGIGRQQVTPYECIACGAVEISPDHYTDPEYKVDEEDARRGWYAGEESHAQAAWTPVKIIVPGQMLSARDFWYGQRVLTWWHRLVHVSYKTKTSKNDIFESLCGKAFTTAQAPHEQHPTCLACITLEGT